MKISYRRTGGFAGMVLSYDFAADSLTEEELAELQELLKKADFFSLPSEITPDSPGADQFQYKLTIEHTVEIKNGNVPENLLPLLDKIRLLSRTS